jgi:hypothetical protein
MSPAIVSRTLSLIPDRVARVPSGSAFDDVDAARCKHPERIAYLVQFLRWLGPLTPLTKDDLRVLGLLSAYGKPISSTQIPEEVSDDEETLESEDELEPLEPLGPPFGETTLPPPGPQAP